MPHHSLDNTFCRTRLLWPLKWISEDPLDGPSSLVVYETALVEADFSVFPLGQQRDIQTVIAQDSSTGPGATLPLLLRLPNGSRLWNPLLYYLVFSPEKR